MAALILPDFPVSSRFGDFRGFPFFPNFPAPYGGGGKFGKRERDPNLF